MPHSYAGLIQCITPLDILHIQAHEVLFDTLLSYDKEQSEPDAKSGNQQIVTSSSSSSSITLASPTSVCNDSPNSVRDEIDSSAAAATPAAAQTILTVNMRLRRSAASQYCVLYTTYTAAVGTDWHMEGEVRLKADTIANKVNQ
jgi:hypothetical protein